MVAVAILAAGRGTRMKSRLPKVLHGLSGRSLVEWVLQSLTGIQPTRCFVIVGYQGQAVQAALTATGTYPSLEFVEQAEQLGTGHAVQQLLPYLQGFQEDLLILNGDVPLLKSETIEQLIQIHRQQGYSGTILTAQLPDPGGYGRVFCNGEKILQQIVEDRDCTPAQKQNHRINAGVYCFRWPDLETVLPQLRAENDQQEYYLTDAVNFLNPVGVVEVNDYQEILGINDRRQLATAYSILQTRIKDAWMARGVTLVDPDSITIEDTVQIEPDVIIEPQTHLRGRSVIQTGCQIGPGTLIDNSLIESNVTALYSVISNSTVGKDSRVGPYAHLNRQAGVGMGCRVGNFVEIKNTQTGDRTNVAHLAYLGDATLGHQVNVGAGTVIANYDGVAKHRTQIGDRTKTGANSVLVAPITLGEDVTVAAGSTVTQDVSRDSLVIARARQTVKPGWRLGSTSTPPVDPDGTQNS